MLLASQTAFSQEVEHEKHKKDSIPVYLKSWTLYDDFSQKEELNPDTLIDNFQIFNPGFQSSFGCINLGNVGLAAGSMLFFQETIFLKTPYLFTPLHSNHEKYDLIFSKQYKPYMLTPENVRFYNTNKPYTHFIYTAGSRSREELTFRIIHSQNVTPALNFGLMFLGVKSTGEYVRQASANKAWGAFLSYEKKRYKAYAVFTNNKFEDEQSGGFNDSIAERGEQLPAILLDAGAESTNFKRTWFFAQSLYFGKRYKHETFEHADSIATGLLIDSLPLKKSDTRKKTDSLSRVKSDSLSGKRLNRTRRIKKDTLKRDTINKHRLDSLSQKTTFIPDSLQNDSLPIKSNVGDKISRTSKPEVSINNLTDTLETQKDTILIDSIKQKRQGLVKRLKNKLARKKDTIKPHKYDYLFSLSHKIRFDHNYHIYNETDIDTIFYPVSFYDDEITYDSTNFRMLTNTIRLKLHENWNKFLKTGMYASVTNEISKYYNFRDFLRTLNDTDFVSNSAKIGIVSHTSGLFQFDINARFYFNGHRKNDYQIDASIKKYFKTKKDTFYLSLSGIEYSKKPDVFENRYFSNHNQWNNDFEEKTYRGASFSAFKPSWRLGLQLDYAELGNFIYFNETAQPDQFKGTFEVLAASLFYHLKLSYFNLKTQIIYQQASNTEILPLPEISAYGSLYFEKRLGVLNTQIGFDGYFNTEWYSPMFMPATSQFYRQYTKKYGNEPLIDFFVNLKLKNRALIFAKVENLYELNRETKYFPIPEYPFSSTAFKFGVSWWFHD